MIYAAEDLKEAISALTSTMNKCEKVLPKLKAGSAQQTLTQRRIKALKISVELLEKELNQSQTANSLP